MRVRIKGDEAFLTIKGRTEGISAASTNTGSRSRTLKPCLPSWPKDR